MVHGRAPDHGRGPLPRAGAGRAPGGCAGGVCLGRGDFTAPLSKAAPHQSQNRFERETSSSNLLTLDSHQFNYQFRFSNGQPVPTRFYADGSWILPGRNGRWSASSRRSRGRTTVRFTSCCARSVTLVQTLLQSVPARQRGSRVEIKAGRQAGNAMLSEAECGSKGKLKGRRERCANGACRSNLLHSCPPRTWPYQRHCLNPESSLKCPSVAVLLDDKGVRPKRSCRRVSERTHVRGTAAAGRESGTYHDLRACREVRWQDQGPGAKPANRRGKAGSRSSQLGRF